MRACMWAGGRVGVGVGVGGAHNYVSRCVGVGSVCVCGGRCVYVLCTYCIYCACVFLSLSVCLCVQFVRV